MDYPHKTAEFINLLNLDVLARSTKPTSLSSLVVAMLKGSHANCNISWHWQEHTVYFITRLLSLPVPADHSGTDSHLIRYAPMLNVLLVGIATVDCVQIFSLHGLVCEAYTGPDISVIKMFGSVLV